MQLPVVRIEHLQSLTYQGTGKPAETTEVSVRLMYDALATGWLREVFTGRSRGSDFLVFMAIALHARPLTGGDLDILVHLGVARPEDEGRLYARVTDLCLADELGFNDRQTIAACTSRLAQAGLIDILPLPNHFKDSKGRFAGTKAYLISGNLTVLQKEVGPYGGGAEHVGSPSPVRVKPSRSKPLSSPTMGGKPSGDRDTVRVEPPQIGGGGDEGGDREGRISWKLLRDRYPRFAWDDHEQEVIEGLLLDGYTAQQIATRIDLTLASRPQDADPIRRLTYFEPIVRQEKPHADGLPPAEVARANGQVPADGLSLACQPTRPAPGLAARGTGEQRPRGQAGAGHPISVHADETTAPGHINEMDLSVVWDMCQRVGVALDERARAALHLLAQTFSSPERDIAEWLRSAVEEAIIHEADNIPAYARRLLARWDEEARGGHLSGAQYQAAPWEGPRPAERGNGPSQEAESQPGFSIADRPASEVWKEILAHLQLRMTKATFTNWLRDTHLTRCDDSTLTVTVPTSYAREWLEHRLHTVVQRVISDVLGPNWKVRFLTAEETQSSTS